MRRIFCIVLAGLLSGTAAGGDPDPRLTPLLDESIHKAAPVFQRMLQTPTDFPLLASLLHEHPKRYAELIRYADVLYGFQKQFQEHSVSREEAIRSYPFRRFARYLHSRNTSNQAFAQRTAEAWRIGWGMTPHNVVTLLRTLGFPSTRRVALEFLKKPTNGQDFGFQWKEEPGSAINQLALARWEAWRVEWRKANPDTPPAPWDLYIPSMPEGEIFPPPPEEPSKL